MNTDSFKEMFNHYRSSTVLRGLLASVRVFEESGYEPSDSFPSIRLATLGNYSTQFLTKGFPIAFANRGIGVSLYEGDYNTWQFDLLDTKSPLYTFKPTHVLLTLTSIELAYGGLKTPNLISDSVYKAVSSLLKNSEARVLITLPEVLFEEISDQTEAYKWRKQVRELLTSSLKDPRISLIDLDPLIMRVGSEKWHDDRWYETSKLPFHPDQTTKVLELFTSAIIGTIAAQCKLVICDLDDTLWAGRVGDDGWQGVNLDPAGVGRYHLRLQLFLKGLLKQGVILAIASKNEAKPVHEVFENRQELILQLDDFVTTQIHWEPKSLSIERILSTLNLTTTGVIFLDDNPAEREEVRRRFPDIVIPELSKNPSTWVRQLLDTGLFDCRAITEESANRQRMYKENAKRDTQLAISGDINLFLADLQMEMTVYDVTEHQDRVVELIQKTNQFNLTTQRYGWAEVASFLNDGIALCYRLTDQFGDNGIISVLLAKQVKPGMYAIDLWLMSCRVMSRGVENAIIDDLIKRLIKKKAKSLIGIYSPTVKNIPVENLYSRLGFSIVKEQADKKSYEFFINNEIYSLATPHIQVIDKARQSLSNG